MPASSQEVGALDIDEAKASRARMSPARPSLRLPGFDAQRQRRR
jgi:hypothetical protein